MKKTKIVCTIGPASNTLPILVKMMKAGMNVARLNFSHGSYPDHARLIKSIRQASRKVGVEAAILQDLQGPRIRIGDLPPEGVDVPRGEKVALVTEKLFKSGVKVSGYKVVPQQYAGLYRDVKPENLILIEDGTIRLKIEKSSDGVIKCISLTGGVIRNHKGINVPGVSLRAKVITEKDMADLKFGISQGIDFVAMSFVKNAQDIFDLRKLISRWSRGREVAPKIIAKIEREDAVRNFDEILEVVDGIMVARGDLGIELPAAQVPLLQKEFIAKCLVAAKPVIVATQMLDSMIRSPIPTRAEVSDVANAVIDHTDAVMLSGESAAGKYPVEAVDTMARILEETERSEYDNLDCGPFEVKSSGEALVQVACALESQIGAKVTLAVTTTGRTARLISRHRPETQIIVFTKYQGLQRQLMLNWGVRSYLMKTSTLEHYLRRAEQILKRDHLVKKNDQMVLISSYPFDGAKEANLIQLHRVG